MTVKIRRYLSSKNTQSDGKVAIAGTKVPVPRSFGTRTLVRAESGRKIAIAGTKVPVPRCF